MKPRQQTAAYRRMGHLSDVFGRGDQRQLFCLCFFLSFPNQKFFLWQCFITFTMLFLRCINLAIALFVLLYFCPFFNSFFFAACLFNGKFKWSNSFLISYNEFQGDHRKEEVNERSISVITAVIIIFCQEYAQKYSSV